MPRVEISRVWFHVKPHMGRYGMCVMRYGKPVVLHFDTLQAALEQMVRGEDDGVHVGMGVLDSDTREWVAHHKQHGKDWLSALQVEGQ